MSLNEATAKLETQEEVTRRQHVILTRLRVFFWLAVAAAVVFTVTFGLIYRESQVRVDQIQESRLVGCEATERAKAALIRRDEELVNVAVEIAEADPEIGQAIIERLSSGHSAEALKPLDCEDVINSD